MCFFIYVSFCKGDGCFLFSTIYEYFMDQVKALSKDERQQYKLQKSTVYLKGKILHQFGSLLIIHTAARSKGSFMYSSEMSLDNIINAWHMVHAERRVQKFGEWKDEKGSCSSFVSHEEFQGSISYDSPELSFRKTIFDFNESLRKQGSI